MKKTLIPLLLFFILVAAVAMGTPELEGEIPSNLENSLTHQEGHISYLFPSLDDFGPLEDGEYIGIIEGKLLDRGEVRVVIENQRIVDVEVIDILLSGYAGKHGNRESLYQDLPRQVLDRQSLRVDDITGATGSTHVFKICLTRALWSASDKEDPMEGYAPY